MSGLITRTIGPHTVYVFVGDVRDLCIRPAMTWNNVEGHYRIVGRGESVLYKMPPTIDATEVWKATGCDPSDTDAVLQYDKRECKNDGDMFTVLHVGDADQPLHAVTVQRCKEHFSTKCMFPTADGPCQEEVPFRAYTIDTCPKHHGVDSPSKGYLEHSGRCTSCSGLFSLPYWCDVDGVISAPNPALLFTMCGKCRAKPVAPAASAAPVQVAERSVEKAVAQVLDKATMTSAPKRRAPKRATAPKRKAPKRKAPAAPKRAAAAPKRKIPKPAAPPTRKVPKRKSTRVLVH